MQKAPWRGRRPAVFVVCVVAAFAATATVLSVSVAATGAGTASANKAKAKSKGQGLTKAEVIGLIKRYSKSGSIGAAGPVGPSGLAGASGSAGAKGETGPKGEKGTNGENGVKGETGTKGEIGAPGENGAVAGYSASQPPTGPDEGVNFTAGTAESPTTVLSKALPAGNYLASATVQVAMVATDPGGEGAVDCSLADVPGSGSPVAGVSGFVSATTAVIPVADLFVAETTLPLEVAVSSTSPSLLAVSCWVNLKSGGESGGTEGTFASEAADAEIQAVQTTGNS